MQLPLAAVIVALHAITPPSTLNVVTASTSCGAAWIPVPSEAVRWTRIDPTQAVLRVGGEIVARLEWAGGRPTIGPRGGRAGSLAEGRVEPTDNPDRLRVEARIRIDTSCHLTIRGLFESDPNARVADQAAAWTLLASAAEAEKDDDLQRAGELAARAFGLVQAASISEFPQKLEFAAFAVEELLQAGHQDKAVETVEVASGSMASDVPPNHPSRLRFEMAHARALSFLDRNEEALSLRLSIQPQLLTVFGPSSDEALSNRLRIANLRLELGDYGRARAELESLRRSVDRYRTPGHWLRIYAIRGLANALGYLDREQDSVGLLAQMRRELVIAHGEDDRRVIDVDEQIARMQIRLEQFEIALQGTSRVFLWRMEHLGFADTRTLGSAWMLALLYKEFGRYDTARALTAALLEQTDRAATAVPSPLARRTLALLGSLEGAQGHIEAAQEILRATWQQYASIVGGDSDDTARALMAYALLLVQSGHIDRMCPVVQETFDQSRFSLRPDLQLSAVAKMLTGLCLLSDSTSGGAVQQGLARLESAWRELQDRQGAGSSAAMYALSTFAWANYRLGNRVAAKRLLQDLVRLAEQSRREAPAGSFTRDYWFSRWLTDHSQNLGYRTLALLHAQDGELDEAVRISELARDRRLHDRFLERDRLSNRLPLQARDELRRLTSAIHELDAGLALETDIVDRVRLESRRTLAIDARNRFEELVNQRYRIEPSQAALPSLEQLRTRVDRQTAMVSIQSSADRWWAIVIAPDTPIRFLMLDREPDLDVAVRAWVGLLEGAPVRVWPASGNRLIQSYERPITAIGRHLTREALAERVSRAILVPLVHAAPRARRFVIVADDDLNGVPFAALPIDGIAAVSRFEMVYAPSLRTYTALCRAVDHPSWSRDLLSFAVDGVAQGQSTAIDDTDDPPSGGDAIRSMFKFASRNPLSYASKEVEAASRNFAPSRTTSLQGPDASKAALTRASHDGLLARYRYVHIAAHAFSFPNDPERSMLILNGGEDAASRVLTAAELANLHMGSELLVLAACRTGGGRYEPGQGLLGFAFAALAAGNRAAVLSLWDVADDLTERFMSSFFGRLRQGMRPSGALRATQREFAQDPNPRMRNPSTWAAFVLYGGQS
jgi:CHAT domain-containing protein/tetratricopeptide (TPR) repeat protein